MNTMNPTIAKEADHQEIETVTPVREQPEETIIEEGKTVGEPFADNAKFKLRDVNVSYGDTRAIKNISLDVAKNEVIAFIGPSGCGKSTFLRCLNRMNDSIEICKVTGSLQLDDQDIYDRRRDVVELRARVGMVFQKPNPFPKSIYDNVAYGPRIHGLANRKSDLDDIVENSLRKAGLWSEVKDRLDATATGMSGGQQQRLCIARAIAVSPEVILMDEPCSALDPIATARVEELMAEMSESYTIVIVTHSMQQAARVSNRTAYFPSGAPGGSERDQQGVYVARARTHRILYHRPFRLTPVLLNTGEHSHAR